MKFVRLVPLLAVLATTFAVLATTFAPARAKADGDPASDMLLAQSVFYPFSPAVATGLQKTLNAEAAAANRAHFPLKVALIDSPVDLGAIPTLFGKPQQYASFLDQEISFANTKDLLLVVMPAGYGVAGLTPRATDAAASLPKPAGRQSDDLARAAFEAIPKLAAAAGHPIGAVSGASGTSKTSGGGGGANLAGVAALAAGAVVVAGVVMWLRRRRAQIR
ncbi:MAG TPA: hypothetical protein VHZ27_10765 [Solirubrobacteraceae bacterium]|nr:hypothetical protein [Solirubrobacteraceae bacterium]